MYKIQSLGSSSKANCFIINDGVTTIMLDAGLPVNEMRKKLFQVNVAQLDIDGVLITHHHSDHMQGISAVNHCKKFITHGELNAAKKYYSGDMSDINLIKTNEKFSIGTFTIMPFPTKHDSPDSVGFLIKNVAGEKLVYMTDTGIANNLVINAESYIIETNHENKDKLLDDAAKGLMKFISDVAKRIVETHLSEKQSLAYLKKCVGKKTKQILLMHISTSHPKPQEVLGRFKKQYGDIVDYIHPSKHDVKKEWVIGYVPTTKRGF